MQNNEELFNKSYSDEDDFIFFIPSRHARNSNNMVTTLRVTDSLGYTDRRKRRPLGRGRRASTDGFTAFFVSLYSTRCVSNPMSHE